MEVITYPARPMNGGRLETAAPKPGHWLFEPKYNGWRALIHVPSRTMFNRHGERLSIEEEFGTALDLLAELLIQVDGAAVEWIDCEALERRHRIGRGSLFVLDFVPPHQGGRPSRMTYCQRRKLLKESLSPHPVDAAPKEDRIYLVPSVEECKAGMLYEELFGLNTRWRARFYEGLVAKRADSRYPIQRHCPSSAFAGWMKHRWDG